MTKENIKAYYVGNTNKIVVVDSNNNTLVNLSIGDMVKIRKDIEELEVLDGFYLYDGMKNVLTYDDEIKITDIDIDSDSGVVTLDLDESGYFFPITVLEDLQDYEAVDIADHSLLEYEDIENIHSLSNGDRLRVKPSVIIGKEYGLYSNVRYTPEQFSEYLTGYELHEFTLPGEFVTVVRVDTSDNTVYCADEEQGIALWYGIEMLQKSLVEESKKKENDDDEIVTFMDKLNRDDEFLAFVEALREIAEFNGIDVPQVEVNEEPKLDLDDDDNYDDFNLDFDDDYDDLDDDYEDDILDERYDGNRFPDYKFDFYQALDELKFQYENEDTNAIWYMTNGERALTFKDERLVDVRLADHVENLVYFAAPIQLKDLQDEWEVHNIVDEEAKKINEIVRIAESLKNENLMLDLLDIIATYTK